MTTRAGYLMALKSASYHATYAHSHSIHTRRAKSTWGTSTTNAPVSDQFTGLPVRDLRESTWTRRADGWQRQASAAHSRSRGFIRATRGP